MLGTTVPNRKIVPETRRHERCQHLERAGAGLEPVLEQLTKGQAMCSCGAWHLKAKLCCQSWTASKKGLPRRASVCQGMPRYAKQHKGSLASIRTTRSQSKPTCHRAEPQRCAASGPVPKPEPESVSMNA